MMDQQMMDQQMKPDLPFLRKWVKMHKEDWGEGNHLANEMQKCLLYVRYLQDRVEQLELYNECFQKIIEEDKKCQTKEN